MRVAVIGLGTMGMGAALNLVKAGHEVHGCDLRDSARAELVAAGGHAAARACDLPDGIEAAIVFVVNAAQAEAVLFGQEGCLPRVAQDGVVLCCTTVAPEAVRALAERIESTGRLLLDAPVSGGAAAARGGSMTVMASGPEAAFARAQPVLDAIAGKVWRLGDAIGAGSTVKMVNQLLAGVHIATAAEQQSAVAEEINRNMSAIAEVIRQLTHNGEATVASSAAMQQTYDRLREIVDHFRLE